MEVQTLAQEYRLQQWSRLISGRKGSGKTVRDWCEEQGVNQRSYYGWQRKIREALGERITSQEESTLLSSCKESNGMHGLSRFAEITPERRGVQKRGLAVILALGGILVDVHNGADPQTVQGVLQALRQL